MRRRNLEHWNKFRPEELEVRNFAHWLVVARQKQLTLGSVVFLLKRPMDSLAKISSAEAKELPRVCAWFEDVSGRLYQPDRFNYIAAMMKDPYVHFHVFPRYETARNRFGTVWTDDAWPKAITLRDVETTEATVIAVRDELRARPQK